MTETMKAVKATLKQISDAYEARDAQALRATMHPDIHIYGTGADEHARGPDAALRIIRRDWKQSDSSSVTFGKIHVYEQGRVAWCDADAAFTATIGGDRLDFEGRLTGVFVRKGSKWLTAQMHLSMPASNQMEGSAFPGAPLLVTA